MNEGLDHLDEEDRARFAAVHLSEEILDFLRSEPGRYLHGRAKMDLEAAKEDLLNCRVDSWWGRRKAARIQARAQVAKAVLAYCVEAIQDGRIAERELSNQQ